MMHFCPNIQETENCANSKLQKTYEQYKMPSGTRTTTDFLQKDSWLQSNMSMVHRKLLLRQLDMRKVHKC